MTGFDISKKCFILVLATHLLEYGTDLRYIQALLFHQIVRTRKVYKLVSKQHIGTIRSPLDFIVKQLDSDDNSQKKKLNE